MICYSTHDISKIFSSLGIPVVLTNQEKINIELKKIYKDQDLIFIDDNLVIDEDILNSINTSATPLIIWLPYENNREVDIKKLAAKCLGMKI